MPRHNEEDGASSKRRRVALAREAAATAAEQPAADGAVALLPPHVWMECLDYLDARSLVRLSWCNHFFRSEIVLSESNKDCWSRHLELELGIDEETLGRLCILSGLQHRHLVMAMLNSQRRHEEKMRVPLYDDISSKNNDGVGRTISTDPRNFGIVSFYPERCHKAYTLANLQRACVDAYRWGAAVSVAGAKASGSVRKNSGRGQFLWCGRGGRASLLFTVNNGLVSIPCTLKHFGISMEGEINWVFDSKEVFVDDMWDVMKGDSYYLELGGRVPGHLKWVAFSASKASPYKVETCCDYLENRNSIYWENILDLVEAQCEIQFGMFHGTASFHYRHAKPGTIARLLSPIARYSVTESYWRDAVHLDWALSRMQQVGERPGSFFGTDCTPNEDQQLPSPSKWAGYDWPFVKPKWCL